MDPSPFDPITFSGAVPVFPLPDAALFPGTLLPLHIFEHRYREMTRAALKGERLIAMARLKPGWEKDYEGNPPVFSVMGMGRILQEDRLEDGRYTLILAGVSRVRLREEIQQSPFRIGRVEVLRERPAEGKGYERKRRLLLSFTAQTLKELSPSAPALPDETPLGTVCDVLAALLRFDGNTRQSFLEELDVAARCDRLLERLQGPGAPDAPEGPWPPAPSLN